MSARLLVLEDFDGTRNGSPGLGPALHTLDHGGGGVTEEQLEEARLASYETGYSAGWEDAAAALEKEQARIGADLAQHLQDLSFTYNEAHAALQKDLADVVRGLIEKVLTPSVPLALGELIETRVAEIVALTHAPIEISVAPENVSLLEPLAVTAQGPPLRLVAEPTLGSGQAFLRFGTAEEQIDLDAVLGELALAVERHFARQDGADARGPASVQPNSEERRHG